VSILITGLYIQHEAILIRQMRFAITAVIEVSAMAIGLSAAIVSAIYGARYWALVINQLVLAVVSAVGMWAACRWRPSLPRRGADVRSLLTFGGNVTGFNVMQYFARNADNALIGKVWGATELGLYSRAYQMLLMPMQQINAPLTAVAVPALSRLADSPERYRDAYLKILEKLVMITMPLCAFMIATSDWLVLFLAGPQWTATGPIFMLLGIAAIIQPVTKTAWWLFSTQGRSRDLFRWGVISAVIAVSSIIGGLPWGAKGVAATYAISDLCIATPLLFWYVGRRGPIRASDFYHTIAPSAAASLCALGTVVTMRPWLMKMPWLIGRLGLAFAVTLAVSLLVFSALPTGRKAIRNLTEVLLSIVRRSPQSLTAAALK
jgi:PST family polysaccharide transporter